MSLGDAVGREPRPVSFVVSMGLGDAAVDRARSHAWLALYPGLRFKLDANPDWTDELVARARRSTGAVDSIDFKGQYRGTVVDNAARPGALPPRRRGASRRVARGSRR